MTMPDSIEAPRLLRAGPLSLQYLRGEVRAVRVGEVEVVSRIYGAVRDRDWNTIGLQVLEQRVEQSSDSQGRACFRVSFLARHREGETCFDWRGEIVGSSHGALRFGFHGLARSSFWRNRIGLCVLHPLQAAGSRARVEHADGSAEEGALPVPIAPRCPFESIAAFEHQAAPGLWARLGFEGEVFEMEDQRNWSDASFKTYGTPLSRPFPVEIALGTRLSQAVTLSLRGRLPKLSNSAALANSAAVRLEVGAAALATLPPLGLVWNEPLRTHEMEALRILKPAHLRCDLRLGECGWPQRLRLAVEDAHALGSKLELALTISAAEELKTLAQAGEQVLAGAPIAAWLLLSPDRGAVAPKLVRAARERLARFDESAAFGSGSDANFAELNRARPMPEALRELDFVSFASNPQVHAFDDASLFETCHTLPSMIASARAFAGRRGVALSPLTLKPRFNAVATIEPGAPAQAQVLEPGAMPANADARQPRLIAAAWAAAALSALAPCGLRYATLFEATGPRGVLQSEADALALFPLFHVLAAANAFAGAQVLPTLCAAPERACGLALRIGTRTRLLLANTTPEPLQLELIGVPQAARVAMLDESSAARARHEPGFLSARGVEERALENGALRLEGYGVARVDFEAG